MVLSMPSPYRHSKTGVYWLRQRVPAELQDRARGKRVAVEVAGDTSRHQVGAELKVSLRTKSVAEAKARATQALAQFDVIWESFRPPNSPDEYAKRFPAMDWAAQPSQPASQVDTVTLTLAGV